MTVCASSLSDRACTVSFEGLEDRAGRDLVGLLRDPLMTSTSSRLTGVNTPGPRVSNYRTSESNRREPVFLPGSFTSCRDDRRSGTTRVDFYLSLYPIFITGLFR